MQARVYSSVKASSRFGYGEHANNPRTLDCRHEWRNAMRVPDPGDAGGGGLWQRKSAYRTASTFFEKYCAVDMRKHLRAWVIPEPDSWVTWRMFWPVS